jgi:hypothetical protein
MSELCIQELVWERHASAVEGQRQDDRPAALRLMADAVESGEYDVPESLRAAVAKELRNIAHCEACP